jgi:hypothetical protein
MNRPVRFSSPVAATDLRQQIVEISEALDHANAATGLPIRSLADPDQGPPAETFALIGPFTLLELSVGGILAGRPLRQSSQNKGWRSLILADSEPRSVVDFLDGLPLRHRQLHHDRVFAQRLFDALSFLDERLLQRKWKRDRYELCFVEASALFVSVIWLKGVPKPILPVRMGADRRLEPRLVSKREFATELDRLTSLLGGSPISIKEERIEGEVQ